MKIAIVLSVLVLCFISFFMGYGAGISDPEPRETRELEKQIKTEELKKAFEETFSKGVGLER